MPSIPLLIALSMAFALGDQFPGAPVAGEEVGERLLDAAMSVFLAASTSLGIGLGLATSIRRSGGRHSASLKVHAILSTAVSVMNLCVYGWILFGLGWIGVVRTGLGLKDAYIADEILILLPYVLAELAAWFGLYPASRELSLGAGDVGVLRHLALRFRLTFGIVLPPLLTFTLVGEILRDALGERVADLWWVQLLTIVGTGIGVLTLSPLFVRLALPTRPLPRGPLRGQLEREARRLKFRTTDILVWDTHGALLNAVVTGLFPWYRYVLLSDGLIERLHPYEIAAIYGHEIGHIRHRHFLTFGLFMVGSMGALALALRPLELFVEPLLRERLSDGAAVGVIDVLAFSLLAGYFFVVFGALSRLLERQADVHGCRAVSCGGEVCPPHGDVDLDDPPGTEADRVCPVGIRIFVEGLRKVAAINGLDPDRFSWRHGSISTRIHFLERLADDPAGEARFERGVRLRLALLFGLLGLAFVAAVGTGAVDLISQI